MTDPTLAERLARCVRKLEWEGTHNFIARTPFGIFGVGRGQDFGRPDEFYCGFGGEDGTWEPTLEAAKAAAQADYQSRILAALDIDALAQEVEAMVGAEKRRCLSVVRKEMSRNDRDGDPWNTGARVACRDIYLAIRAREGGKP
jgi:hypothetical protein